MRIAGLGTGIVGQTIGAKLLSLGQDVWMGTRDVEAVMARTEPARTGAPPCAEWAAAHPDAKVVLFKEAAANGEIVFNATSGAAALDVLQAAGAENLAGKILIDISNGLDFSAGVPRLTVANTDSIGELVQRSFPDARVVKTLNTVTAAVMVDPDSLAGGDHDVFVCGNDNAAKSEVAGILTGWFGWRGVVDLGDITSARAVEMYLPLWIRLWGVHGTPVFNIKVVR
ncbi:MAG: NADPH-dependent F420 reductase [Actinomycetota bacterium]